MQVIKKMISFLLAAALIMSLSPMTVLADPTVGPVHVVNDELELAAALGSLSTDDTIQLTADIEYLSEISIDNMIITFDLNEHNLNVIYIPKIKSKRCKWGEKTDTKAYFKERNFEIYNSYKNGTTVFELSEKYFLTPKSIQRIIRSMQIL